MGILKQFKINDSINTVEENNIVYTAYYKDRGDGYSNIECKITINPFIFNDREYFFSIDNIKIPNKLIENDMPAILLTSDKKGDYVSFTFPEEQEEYFTVSRVSYQVDIELNSIKTIPHGEKISLSNNAKPSHSSNKYHSYSEPEAIELPHGDIMITAIDLNDEGQYVTAWLLEKEQGLKFNVNEGSNRVTNRLLFKINKNLESSFLLLSANKNDNDNVGNIIYLDSDSTLTSLFFLKITQSMVDDIRGGKYVNNKDEECLFAVGKERCNQFDKKVSTPFLTGKDISNLNAVNTKNGVTIAFLENGRTLCSANLTGKKGEKPEKHPIYDYKEKIKSLQLTATDESDVIISAVGEKNIFQSIVSSSDLKVFSTKSFPIDAVKTLSDFIDIIYNIPPKLTTAFAYTTLPTVSLTSDTPKVSPEISTTSSLATKKTTTKENAITSKKSTTNAATTGITTQSITTGRETTGHTTVEPSTTSISTMQPTTSPKTTTTTKKTTTAKAETSTTQRFTTEPSTTTTTQPNTTTSPQTTTSTERATTTAKTTVKTSTTQHTVTDQSTIKTTVKPTTVTPSKITTSTKKTTPSTQSTTNQATKTTTKTTRVTTSPTKATIRSTARSTNRYITGTAQGSITSTSLPKSTTTEVQNTTVASTAALGLTTLMSTIGSSIVSILTQNATNTLTTEMITGDFNKTDTPSNYEGKSLNTAEISAAIAVPMIVIIGGISYFIYRHCCRSNMRLPSDITNDVGFWQRFRSCFSRQRQTIPEFQLESLRGNCDNQIDNSEYEVNQNSASNSTEDLLKQNQSGATYSTFTSTNNADLEAGQRDRSDSKEGADNMTWDHGGDIGAAQYGETDVSSELDDTKVSNTRGQNSGVNESRV